MKFSFTEIELILTALDNHIIDNRSCKTVTITVGESILMLINACKENMTDRVIIDKLKALYLEGVKSADDKDFIRLIKEQFADRKQFHVSSDPKIINADPTRRYFETHLAYHLLQSKAESLDTKKLIAFTENLIDNLNKVLMNHTQNVRQKVNLMCRQPTIKHSKMFINRVSKDK